MIEINLIPDVKRELIKAQRIRATVIMGCIVIGIFAIAVVSMLASYVFIGQAVRGNSADSVVKTESSKLLSVEDLSKTISIQNQLLKLDELNNNKMMSSRIFSMVIALIPPDPNTVKISKIEVQSDMKTVSMDVQASNGYATLEIFKKTLDRAYITYRDELDAEQSVQLASDVSTDDISYGADSTGNKVLRFSIVFKYADELFSIKSKNVGFKIIGGGNVTDSYLGFPKSIFTTPAVDVTEGQ